MTNGDLYATFKITANEYCIRENRSVFEEWFNNLTNEAASKVVFAIEKLRRGLLSQTKSLKQGLYELKVHFGPGYRIYFCMSGPGEVTLLNAGDKRTQQNDIKYARQLLTEFKHRNKFREAESGTN